MLHSTQACWDHRMALLIFHGSGRNSAVCPGVVRLTVV
jgi:hypothetical protein